MKKYIVYDYEKEPINWEEVPYIMIQEFPWYKEGVKQDTKVQMAISNDTIYIHMWAEDQYIRATAKNLNDPVYEDSCFEFFITPWNEKSKEYFNIEINCIGTLYMAYRDRTEERQLISDELAKFIKIDSSLSKGNLEGEKDWSLQISIPLQVLKEIAGKNIADDKWYGNFYRCGGLEDDQYGCWNPIEFPYPNYHQPEQFGELIIIKVGKKDK